jgi:hypothetical protein
MRYPPTQTPPELPRDVAMQVAELARVPAGECDDATTTVSQLILPAHALCNLIAGFNAIGS